MTNTEKHVTSCREHRSMSRRGLLRGTLAGAAGGVAISTFGGAFMQTAYAATRTAPATLVVLSMRGAADGLSLVVPHADPAYYAARPNIAVPAANLLAKDGFFGLHPKMEPLLPLWNSGKLAAVHATGLPVANRSHFAAMEELEDADPGSDARIGWLNRLIGRDTYTNPLQAIQVGNGVPAMHLYGPEAILATANVDAVELTGYDAVRRPQSMHTVWDSVTSPLGAGARSAMQACLDFDPVQATSKTPANGATYPNSDLGKALTAAARIIRGDVGAEVITVDQGAWDMHQNLGTLGWGEMIRNVDDFAKSLAAFFTDLGPLASKVTVVTISEFGRRVAENSTYGLDHGWGNAMFLAGAGVKGGKYYANWPGLVNDPNADLKVTTDYRSVLAEVVTTRFGASTAAVFPGFTPQTVGVMTSI